MFDFRKKQPHTISSSGGVLCDIARRDGRVDDFLLPSKCVLAEIDTLQAGVRA